MQYSIPQPTSWSMLADEQDAGFIRHKETPWTWHNSYAVNLYDWYLHGASRRVAVDMGASYGWMSLAFSAMFDSVHAFEIRRDVANCLIENMWPYPNVLCHPVGLSNQRGTVNFTYNSSTGISKVDDHGEGSAQVVALDSFQLHSVDLIKMDIEGHELPALMGSIDTVSRCKPILLIEIHSDRNTRNRDTRHQLFRLLREAGYVLVDTWLRDFIFVHKDRLEEFGVS